MSQQSPSTLPILFLKASSLVALMFLSGLTLAGIVPGRAATDDTTTLALIAVAVALIAGAGWLGSTLRKICGGDGAQNGNFLQTLIRIVCTEAGGLIGFVLTVVSLSWWVGFSLIVISFLSILVIPTADAGIAPAE